MINIDVDLSKCRVKIDGHADFDEEGKDIVCSAISILFFSMCQTLDTMKGHKCFVNSKISWDKGVGNIRLKPKPEFKQNVAIIFMTICNGFDIVATTYPDFVTLNVKE